MNSSAKAGSMAVPMCVLVVGLALGATARAVEIRLFDNTRVNACIESVQSGELLVTTMEGADKKVALNDILTIQFRGRERRLLLTGAQELWFVNGDRLRGTFQGITANSVNFSADSVGKVPIDFRNVKGFISMPQIGRVGREAQELVESSESKNPFLDVILEQRGSRHEGVIQDVTRDGIDIDHEDMQETVNIKTSQLAGARFADAHRKARPELSGDVFLRFWTLDGSVLDGKLVEIELGRWTILPMWAETQRVFLNEREISLIQVLNGRRMYLSQLTPIRVKEATRFSPPQPYRIDRNCKGTRITIRDRSYPWGIGVHAHSELTFKINKAFNTFQSFAGVDGLAGNAGSVIFSVWGDGKELYKSPLIKGSTPEPQEISVSVKGVDELTLKVEDGDGLDFNDLANWASPQLIR
jgi:hypothetical protein